jgi:hypothetical protein
MINKIALSGQLRVGKDYVAQKAGFKPCSLSEPMLQIAERIFGTRDKSKPGMREFLQFLGQAGNGQHEKINVSQASLILHLREKGQSMVLFPYNFMNWHNFGKIPTFWVDMFIRSLKHVGKNQRIAVTNVRFPFELEPLKENGFEHFHVTCHQVERLQRLNRLGEVINEELDNDLSERFAKQLNKEMPHDRVIWNDNVYPNNGYLSLERFCEIVNE